jgi:hypothetical protein
LQGHKSTGEVNISSKSKSGKKAEKGDNAVEVGASLMDDWLGMKRSAAKKPMTVVNSEKTAPVGGFHIRLQPRCGLLDVNLDETPTAKKATKESTTPMGLM